jgi:hypothetical protein
MDDSELTNVASDVGQEADAETDSTPARDTTALIQVPDGAPGTLLPLLTHGCVVANV